MFYLFANCNFVLDRYDDASYTSLLPLLFLARLFLFSCCTLQQFLHKLAEYADHTLKR